MKMMVAMVVVMITWMVMLLLLIIGLLSSVWVSVALKLQCAMLRYLGIALQQF